jgi:hypothetical protein
MARGHVALLGVALALGCRTEGQPAGERTASAYSAGTDSGADAQKVEGTTTGTQYQAPALVPGVVTALNQLKQQASKDNFAALRGSVEKLQDAMRADLTRAGVSDTGTFRSLSDSLSRDLGGGAGDRGEDPTPERVARVNARVRRLMEVYDGMTRAARK